MQTELTAYPVGPIAADGWTIDPAPATQEWMTKTQEQAALRCLPLLIATQAGWVIRCPVGFKVTWDGKRAPNGSLAFEWSEPPGHHETQIMSNFGMGILTFKIPWLFRTSPGIGLIVRGPVNLWKDNTAPLEGLVETDWAPYTFTMNWKIIAPKRAVWFKKGEPVCMIVPYPMQLLEHTRPSFSTFDDREELFQEHLNFRDNRRAQQEAATAAGSHKEHFKLDYMRGLNPNGTFAMGNHRSSLKLAAFQNSDS